MFRPDLATSVDPLVGFRFPRELLEAIDAWGAASELPARSSHAIRRLVELGLKAKAKR